MKGDPAYLNCMGTGFSAHQVPKGSFGISIPTLRALPVISHLFLSAALEQMGWCWSNH